MKMSATKWTNRVQFPRDNFVLRVIEEKFLPSKSSGNPMITLGFEVVSPDEYNIGGEDYVVAGAKTTSYYPTIVLDSEGTDVAKTENAQVRVKDLYRMFGLDDNTINFENPVLGFKGKLVHALVYSDEQAQRRSPTKDQLAKGIKQGEIILDPITKKPVVSYYPKIDRIYGLAQDDSSVPY